jgi:hypothetical protein
MFDRKYNTGPRVGRMYVAIRKSTRGDKNTWVLQLATRTETGYTYGKPIHDMVFVSYREAVKYRRENIYGNQSAKGGFKPEAMVLEVQEPGKVLCRQCGMVFKTVYEAYEHAPQPFENCKKLASCGHISYRNHDNLCIKQGCKQAAYQTPGEE